MIHWLVPNVKNIKEIKFSYNDSKAKARPIRRIGDNLEVEVLEVYEGEDRIRIGEILSIPFVPGDVVYEIDGKAIPKIKYRTL